MTFEEWVKMQEGLDTTQKDLLQTTVDAAAKNAAGIPDPTKQLAAMKDMPKIAKQTATDAAAKGLPVTGADVLSQATKVTAVPKPVGSGQTQQAGQQAKMKKK